MHNYISGEYIFGDAYYIPSEYQEEKWWYIDGAPGYMISNCGRVWSEKSQAFMVVKPLDAHGHLGVCLTLNGKRRYEYIHRLMARAFIPNQHDYPVVRHLNDDPTDNSIDNLAWGTLADNYRDCVANGHAHIPTAAEREKSYEMSRTPIRAYDLRTGSALNFGGQGEAARELGIPQANIWKVLNGQRAHAGGYFFEYIEGGESDGNY